MEKLNGVLGEMKGMSRFLKERKVEQKIRLIWPTIAGQLADELRVAYFRESVLYVSSSNSVWKAEVAFISDHILKQLSKTVNGAHVKRLQVIDDGEVVLPSRQSKRDVPSGDLRQLILGENRRRIEAGMSLCNECQAVFTHEDCCVFCRCSRNGS